MNADGASLKVFLKPQASGLGPADECCAIIPAYEEGRQIAQVVREALAYAAEVFVIDDGSADDTSRQAAAAGATVLRHERNLGKGCALQTGLRRAAEKGHEIAVTLDGDGQHDPREIPKLLRELRRGADIVVGCRMQKPDGMPPDRLLTNMLMSSILGILTKCRIRDTQSGFKALRIRKVRELQFSTSRFDWESELIIKAARRGLRMREVGVKSIYANHHRSKIKVVSDTYRFMKLVLSNMIY
jgi:glycosyltransferase involved in cell wall biosynthesis